MNEQIPPEREWLSYREAQTVSGYGRTTLWSIVARGEIAASRCGRSVRINRKSLQDYMWSRVPGSDLDDSIGGRS